MGSGQSSSSVHPPQAAPVAEPTAAPAVIVRSRFSNASAPPEYGDRRRISLMTNVPKTDIFEIRSPSAARTPPQKIREIRKSVILHEQTLKQLEALKEREDKEQARRRSTQLTNLQGQSGRGEGLLGKRPPRLSVAPSTTTSVTGAPISDSSNIPHLNSIVEEKEAEMEEKDAEAVDENPCASAGPSSSGVQLETGLRPLEKAASKSELKAQGSSGSIRAAPGPPQQHAMAIF